MKHRKAKTSRREAKLAIVAGENAGTSAYRDYSRSYEIGADGKPVIYGSADPAFRRDRSRWNPEELLVASLSAYHKLWYLHLAAEAGIIVTAYTDRAEGVRRRASTGRRQFKRQRVQSPSQERSWSLRS